MRFLQYNDIVNRLNSKYVEVFDMSRVCSVCGKGKLSGNLVSHSNRKTPRSYNANVQKVKVVVNGVVSKQYVCARCLKSNSVERA